MQYSRYRRDGIVDCYWKDNHCVTTTNACPEGMAYIPKLGGYCIDKYEASHSDATPCPNGTTWATCSANYGSSPIPASQPNVIPWVQITQTNARTACTAAGKHLCTSAEWLAAANLNGTIYYLDDTTTKNTCIVDSTLHCLDHSYSSGEACNTGTNKNTTTSNCKSREGVYDMIGNVWEWTNDVMDVPPESINGWQYLQDTTIPEDWGPGLWGNTTTKSLKYGNDGVYLGTETKTNRAVRRGGAWNRGSNAGLFSADLTYSSGSSDNGDGFRCCSSPS